MSINAAIAAARAAAENVVADDDNVPATTAATGGGVAVVRPGAPMGFNDVASGSLSVDAWLKVGYHGMQVGTNPGLVESLDVIIDLDRIQFFMGVRYGNPAVYKKTYDNLVDIEGQSWVQTVANGQKVDPRVRPYRGADIVMTTMTDVLDIKGKTVIEAGKDLGHSTSVTGWKSFESFYRELMGMDGVTALPNGNLSGQVQVTVGYDPQKNEKGQWGVLTFNSPKLRAAA